MRRAIIATVIVAAVATSGCSVFKSRANATPDEFAVARNAPLVIPPDYTLTPPVAGTAALTPQDAQQQAIDALFGGPAPRSQSELNLLEKAGRDRALVGARSTASDPDTRVVDKGPTTMAILNAPESDGHSTRSAPDMSGGSGIVCGEGTPSSTTPSRPSPASTACSASSAPSGSTPHSPATSAAPGTRSRSRT